MKTIEYDKLVRDKIPQIINKNGKKCAIEVLDDQKYFDKLTEKLHEEVAEFDKAIKAQDDENALKELADIQEVVLALSAAIGLNAEGLEKIRLAKRTTNGGFDCKLLLKSVTEEDSKD